MNNLNYEFGEEYDKQIEKLVLPGKLLNEEQFTREYADAYENLLSITNLIENQQNNQLRFIGQHPTSLTRDRLTTLLDNMNDFVVCEKTDGVRYLLIILTNNECLLSGRKTMQIEYYKVNLPLPNFLKEEEDNDSPQIKYIFDGELVVDLKREQEDLLGIENENVYKWRFLIFDTIYKYQSNSNRPLVHKQNYLERLKHALSFRNLLDSTKEILKKANQKNVVAQEVQEFPKIKLKVKDFFDVRQTEPLLTNIINVKNILPHKNDGLIYTRISSPYCIGPTENILKWKPPEENTIDFFLVPNIDSLEIGYYILDLYCGTLVKGVNKHTLFDFMIVNEEQFQDFVHELNQDTAGLISECGFDITQDSEDIHNAWLELIDVEQTQDFASKAVLKIDLEEQPQFVKNHLNNLFERKKHNRRGNWVLKRIRKDKDTGNAYKTALNVFTSIQENLNEEKLFEAITVRATANQNKQNM